MRRAQILPNIVTAFALSCGLFMIFKMSMVQPGEATYKVLLFATGLLLLAAVADALDGAIARAMKAESDFGGLFDSLADAITFGVGPSIIVLKTLSQPPGTTISFFITAAAMVYSVCGVLRLVRYNILSMKAKGDEKQTQLNNKNFTGLPIPAAAAAVISANLFLASDDFKSIAFITETTQLWIMFFVMLVMGYFMVSRWKFLSIKALSVKISSFQAIIGTVFLSALLIYGLTHHIAWMFLIMTWSYVIIAWLLSIIRMISGKDSQTLEDFDLDDEIEEEL